MGAPTPVALSVWTPKYGTVVVAASDGCRYHADLTSFSSVYCFPHGEEDWGQVSIDSDGLGLIWPSRFEVHMDQVVGLAHRREEAIPASGRAGAG